MFYNIEKLAKLTGLTRRTIRYYVQRGLLQKPEGAGRGSCYTDDHLERIRKIKSWADEKIPLERMKALLAGKPETFEFREECPTYGIEPRTSPLYYSVTPDAWTRRAVTPDVELLVRGGALAPRDLAEITDFIRVRLLRGADEYGG